VFTCRRPGPCGRVDAHDCWAPPRRRERSMSCWRSPGGQDSGGETDTFSVSCRIAPDSQLGTRYLVVNMVLAAWRGRAIRMHWNACRIYDQLEAGDFAGVKLDYITCCSVVAFLAKSKRRCGTERADQILRRLDNHDGIVGKAV
jgi:hypothetical protein